VSRGRFGIRRLLCAVTATIGLLPSPLWAQEEPPTPGAVESVSDSPTLLQTAAAAATASLQLEQVIQQPKGPPPTPRHTGIRALVRNLASDVRHLPSKQNLFWVGVGGGLAVIAHPFDDNVQGALVGNDFAEAFFAPGQLLGHTATLTGSASLTYVVGRLRDQPRVSHVGMDLIQALAVSQGLAQALKYSVRRERPDGSSRTSFPSGHAASTFAFATALERHLGWRGAVPAYIFSSYVAISRLPANRHWLSDAVFGASVGIIAGRTVTRHGREYPVTVMSVPGGAMIAYSR
jgi:membrane-associated phospholipid phosphatase